MKPYKLHWAIDLLMMIYTQDHYLCAEFWCRDLLLSLLHDILSCYPPRAWAKLSIMTYEHRHSEDAGLCPVRPR